MERGKLSTVEPCRAKKLEASNRLMEYVFHTKVKVWAQYL